MSKIDEYTKENLAALQPNVDKAKADNDTLYANKEKTLRDTAQQEIDLQSQSYEEDARRIEVQKYINEREVAEANANLGLTQSGLNATQMTAVKLSASNNQAKIERDKQNMIKTITHELNSLLAENENERLSKNAKIEQDAYDQAYSGAVSRYNTEVEQAQKAEAEAQKEAKSALSEFKKDMEANEYDKLTSLQKVVDFVELYGVDETMLGQVLRSAGVSEKEYIDYCERSDWHKKHGLTGNKELDRSTVQSLISESRKDMSAIKRLENGKVQITFPNGKTKTYKMEKLKDTDYYEIINTLTATETKDIDKRGRKKATYYKYNGTLYRDTSDWNL